ncbi:beta-lactamase regulator AmpE [Rheinheimera sp.]|uniref:beta-lactamase regulator AmpE n=1 Tax=Rheinheimera sp. TaxID=1869214 RepID=UPI00261BE06A|nr:beta-lactamase regulator AmpE [Rheinheimera sp.]MCA1929202.1 beta-lactamase regulator AmpE [Rheinheimera sp.]
MTLISMLIALIIERLAVRSEAWQFLFYAKKYLSLSHSSGLSKISEDSKGQYLWVLLPGILYAALLWFIGSSLVTLVLNTLVLLVCIGCWHYRQLYKQYLNASERADNEAAFLTMQQLSADAGLTDTDLSYGQRLVWLNFRYYAAVLFWFAILGGAGAITYALLRQLNEPASWEQPMKLSEEQSDNAEFVAEAPAIPAVFQQLMFWADWVPARLFGVGLALVGHFSRASAALLTFLGDFSSPSATVITTVAKAAEPLPDDSYNCAEETACMVQLAKRNVLFFLALVAVLTLSGWLG